MSISREMGGFLRVSWGFVGGCVCVCVLKNRLVRYIDPASKQGMS